MQGDRGRAQLHLRLRRREGLAHLGLADRAAAELPLSPQLLQVALLVRGAALLLGEPPPVLLGGAEARRRELGAELSLGGELAPHPARLFLHRVLDVGVADRDGGVEAGLLVEDLLVHHALEHLAAERVAAGGIGGQLLPLGLQEQQLLLDLGKEDRPVADQGDDPVDRLRPHPVVAREFHGVTPDRGRNSPRAFWTPGS